MSAVPQTLALTMLAQMYRGDTVRQINRQCSTLKLLPIVRGSGKNIAWVPEADGATAANYADGADAADFNSDVQASAILPWGLYRSNFIVSGLAMAAAASTGSPVGNTDLWGRQCANAATKLASVINAAVHAGAGTTTLIAGFAVALADATNTYAGINRATGGNEYFRPSISDPGSPTIPTFASIRKHQGLIYDACGEMPDVAFCPTAVFDTIGSLFDGNRQYLVNTVETARGKVSLDAGYEGISFNGTVFVKDKDAVANKIIFVNTRHTRIEYLPPAMPGLELALAKLAEKGIVAPNDGFGMVPLSIVFEALAKAGDADKAQAKAYLQLVCDRPNTGGAMLNVGTV